MDNIQRRVAEKQAEILNNLNHSITADSRENPVLTISVEQFQEQLSKGVKFYTPENIKSFQNDAKKRIVGTYDPDKRESLEKSIQTELLNLEPVNVQTATGQLLSFYTQKQVVESE